MSAGCRRCGHDKADRPRGLCWHCYYAPGVRERYASTSKFAYRGVGGGMADRPLPSEATDIRPGTVEKIELLTARAAREEALFHPDDVTVLPGDDRLMADGPH